jgi:hypothetical protein
VDEVDTQVLLGRTALAGAVAAISVVNPALGIAASAALPALETAASTWQGVRAARTVRALNAAAATSGISPDEVVDRLISDDQLITQMAAALNAAANTELKEKIDTLGRSLGQLAMDPATVDTEQLWIRIFSDIDTPHVRALQELLKEDRELPGHFRLIRAGDLGHFIASPAMASVVLQTLERHGLAQRPDVERLDRHTRARYGIGPPTMERLPGVWYMGDVLARECQQRLEAAADS